jgi:hypothetical protein
LTGQNISALLFAYLTISLVGLAWIARELRVIATRWGSIRLPLAIAVVT